MEQKPRQTKKKSKKTKAEISDAVPSHIMNIMKSVEKKSQRKEQDLKKQQSMDSINLIRNMMSSVRTKYELSEAAEEVRKDKEKDIRMISNARDIFKHLECAENEPVEKAPAEKVKKVEVQPDFLLEGQNKAEEIRKERLKEMAAMKAARERQLEEEERMGADMKNRGDELRKQREREMDMMRMMRQQALEEEEERLQNENDRRFVRQVSPGLAAARQGFKPEGRLEEEDRVEKLRQDRERELEQMRRDRQMQLEQNEAELNFKTEKSEAARELEAFRASQGKGVKNRFIPQDAGSGNSERHGAKGPRPKARLADNWMGQQQQDQADRAEELRRARALELEMMLNARNIAFEEEEEERLAAEAARRHEAASKAKEMAILVAELQRMRNDTQREAEEDEKMTRYQEEMMQRVMELHAIARGDLISN